MCFASVSPYEEKRAGGAGWNRGKTCPQYSGDKHWSKNNPNAKQIYAEIARKCSATKTGVKQSPEWIQKRVDCRAGYQHSEEVKERIRLTNLETWSNEEIRLQSVGPNNPCWIGNGIEDWERVSEETRNRDGRVCQWCGKTEDENGERLSVHHEDGNHFNQDEYNRISICRSCHVRYHNNLAGQSATKRLLT